MKDEYSVEITVENETGARWIVKTNFDLTGFDSPDNYLDSNTISGLVDDEEDISEALEWAGWEARMELNGLIVWRAEQNQLQIW